MNVSKGVGGIAVKDGLSSKTFHVLRKMKSHRVFLLQSEHLITIIDDDGL